MVSSTYERMKVSQVISLSLSLSLSLPLQFNLFSRQYNLARQTIEQKNLLLNSTISPSIIHAVAVDLYIRLTMKLRRPVRMVETDHAGFQVSG